MASQIRVLVATTDAALLETIGFILIDAGYHVVLAWSGSVAQHRVQTFHPTVIILDPMFQIGDQLALGVCRKSLCPDTPIIAVSMADHLREMAITLGANDFLTRPVDRNLLLSCIARYTGLPTA